MVKLLQSSATVVKIKRLRHLKSGKKRMNTLCQLRVIYGVFGKLSN